MVLPIITRVIEPEVESDDAARVVRGGVWPGEHVVIPAFRDEQGLARTDCRSAWAEPFADPCTHARSISQ